MPETSSHENLGGSFAGLLTREAGIGFEIVYRDPKKEMMLRVRIAIALAVMAREYLRENFEVS